MDRRSLSSAQYRVSFCPLSIRLSPAMIDRKGMHKLTWLSRILLTQQDNLIWLFVKLTRHRHKQDVAGLRTCYSQFRIDFTASNQHSTHGAGRACTWLGIRQPNSSSESLRPLLIERGNVPRIASALREIGVSH